MQRIHPEFSDFEFLDEESEMKIVKPDADVKGASVKDEGRGSDEEKNSGSDKGSAIKLNKKQTSEATEGQSPMFSTFYKTNSFDESQQYKNTAFKWVNNILYMSYRERIITYYIPVYMRMKVKNITKIEFDTFRGSINAAMMISIYYGDLDSEIVTHIKNNTRICFSKGMTVKIGKKSLDIDMKDKKQDQMINFTIRNFFTTYIQSEVAWTPFDIMQMVLSVEISCKSLHQTNKKIKIKYNFMDCDDEELKFSTTEERHFGIYAMAERLNEVEYTNEKVYSKSDSAEINNVIERGKLADESETEVSLVGEKRGLLVKQKFSSFKYAHFVLSLYRKPLPFVMTVFFPVVLLGIINLGIFYQQHQATGKKMLNVGALMVSYIALLPTVREKILESRKISIAEVLVFAQALTSLFTMLQTIEYRNRTSDEDGSQDPYFILSLIVTSLIVAVISVLVSIHYLYWKNIYHKQAPKTFKFVRKNWYHQKCSRYFERAKRRLGIKLHTKDEGADLDFILEEKQNEIFN